MIGSLLSQDLILASRRNRLHVIRWIYAGWLVLVLVGMELLDSRRIRPLITSMIPGAQEEHLPFPPQALAAQWLDWYLWQQTILIFLLTPLFAASAVVEEKNRGTLQYLLLAEVSPFHLFLSKTLSRFFQILFIVITGFPLWALLAGLARIEPTSMALYLLATLVPLFGITAMTVLASVFCKQTRNAVILSYLLLFLLWMITTRFRNEPRWIDPNWVLNPAWSTGDAFNLREGVHRGVVSGLIWLLVTIISVTIGSSRLLPIYKKDLENFSKPAKTRTGSTMEREPISEYPVQWKEQYIDGLALFSALKRIPMWIGVVFVAVMSIFSSVLIFRLSLAPGANLVDVISALLQMNIRQAAILMPRASTYFLVQAIGVMVAASLIVGIRCAGSITQEKERGTWELLLLTPIPAGQIVRGKLWGIIHGTTWYLMAYATPTICFSAVAGILALSYTVFWLGATWLAMYFIGATGLWCSVSATNSWRSLLSTVGIGYLGGLVVYSISSPLIGLFALLLVLFLALLDWILKTGMVALVFWSFPRFLRIFSLASAIVLGLTFWFFAKYFLRRAQRWIADRERTRHWYEDSKMYKRGSRLRRPLED